MGSEQLVRLHVLNNNVRHTLLSTEGAANSPRLGVAADEPSFGSTASSVGSTSPWVAEALATRLVDDARVKAYDIVGDRERAVAIMERRLGR
jgi:hypothetical protein